MDCDDGTEAAAAQPAAELRARIRARAPVFRWALSPPARRAAQHVTGQRRTRPAPPHRQWRQTRFRLQACRRVWRPPREPLQLAARAAGRAPARRSLLARPAPLGESLHNHGAAQVDRRFARPAGGGRAPRAAGARWRRPRLRPHRCAAPRGSRLRGAGKRVWQRWQWQSVGKLPVRAQQRQGSRRRALKPTATPNSPRAT